MTMPTREELREAVRSAAYACDWAAREMHDEANEDAHPGLRDHHFTRSREYAEAAITLRAFLDSGLTDSERETVREVVRWMDNALAKATRSRSGVQMDRATLREWLAALAPIAEGK